MSKAKKIILPALALTLICLAASLALAIVNANTADVIRDNLNKKAVEGAAAVLQAESFEEIEPVAPATAIYRGTDASGAAVGYVFRTQVSGYGGTIEVLTGIAADGTVTGVGILSDSETPGLGKRVETDEFRRQFAGKSGELSVDRLNPGDNEIQALSGATISSKAVTKAVNEAQEAFEGLEGRK